MFPSPSRMPTKYVKKTALSLYSNVLEILKKHVYQSIHSINHKKKTAVKYFFIVWGYQKILKNFQQTWLGEEENLWISDSLERPG